MKSNRLVITMLTMLPVAAAASEDPYSRDENISSTTVSVTHEANSNGHYVYSYDVVAPSSNTGSVHAFLLDISCSDVPDSLGFNPLDYPKILPDGITTSNSEDGKHVPVYADGSEARSAFWTISVDNKQIFLLSLEPGSESRGIKVVSPYPPGDRQYELTADVNYRASLYDYSGIEDPTDPSSGVPWLLDWNKSGVVAGPACPGEEYPREKERFSGSEGPSETSELNGLLTYSSPLTNQMEANVGQESIEFIIHYSADVDPKTFNVMSQRHGVRRFFNPDSGTSETVVIPLDSGKNRLQFQIKKSGWNKDKPEDKSASSVGRNTDKDVFIIRVPSVDGVKGKGKK